MADKAHDMPPLSDEQMAELEANGVITLAPHACGRADAQLAEYNYGRPDGPIDYRVHCHGCRILTFPFETPQEAFAAWHRHLALTGANEVDRLRAREVAAMAIVRDVAKADATALRMAAQSAEYLGTGASDAGYDCQWCHQYILSSNEHAPDCPITLARALLAQE